VKSILVTGGAGFIGSHFIRHIITHSNDYRIVNLDLLTYAGNISNLEDISDYENYIFVQGDIRNETLVNELFDKYAFDYVINFAAESHVDRSIVSSNDFVSTNIQGTHTLLESARQAWSINDSFSEFAKGKKFIQISTDEVYGALDKFGAFNETSPLKPNSPYAASKAAADLLVMSYYHTYGFPANITRSSNNFGPNQYPEKLIPKIIELARMNKSLPIYGKGDQIRVWIHVSDHCRAIELVLHKARAGEIYNIGANNEIRNIDLVIKILERLNKPISLIQFVPDRLGHDYRYAIDNSKLSNDLGWKPQVDFDLALDMLITI
jgi:dTDP-glucose 4,6-dehydratase